MIYCLANKNPVNSQRAIIFLPWQDGVKLFQVVYRLHEELVETRHNLKVLIIIGRSNFIVKDGKGLLE